MFCPRNCEIRLVSPLILPLEIFTDGNTILLRKYRADGCCDLCGEVTGDSILFRGKRICAACRKELAKL